MGRNIRNCTGMGSFRLHQQTIKTDIGCAGHGLHSGVPVALRLLPAPPNTGIVFRRTDAAGAGCELPALWQHVADTQLCTALGDGRGRQIGTVEHLMAALAGCGVDNVVVEVDGPEVPVMDGSAEPFVFLIECAGVVRQEAPLSVIEVLKTVRVGDAGKCAMLTPGPGRTFSFEIEFEGTLIDRQKYFFDLAVGAFGRELSRARTFGFDHEIASLRAMGLAKGGSLDNAIVVSGQRILNDGGLRYEDEFVRHKLLDSIGDLALAGAPVIGHYHGDRAGHALTNALLRRLFTDRSAWRAVAVEDAWSDHDRRDWHPDTIAATA